MIISLFFNWKLCKNLFNKNENILTFSIISAAKERLYEYY